MSSIEAFEKQILLRIKTHLKEILLTDMVKDYMAIFSSNYDFLIDRPGFRKDDYTAPLYIKPAVMEYVRNSLVQGIQALDVKGPMQLSAVDDDVFSLPDNKDRDPLKLFHFYLYGTIGEYVVFTSDLLSKIIGEPVTFGRFGNMILWPRERYDTMYAKHKGGTRGWPTAQQIRHPFSGAAPSRLFEVTWDAVLADFGKYIKKAKSNATKS